MPPNRRTRFVLPLLLAALTFALILLALWPNDPPTVAVLVASRDLGASSVLTAADLTPLSLEAGLTPADAIADPVSLVGQTLAVVRFQGEPVTLRHLGPAVAVQSDERAVSLRVEQDQGLAGILRPGMHVGVIATLEDELGGVYAKAMLEDLRVVYVSPDFQARPDLPVTAEMTVNNGESSSVVGGSSAASRRSTTASSAANQAREGVVIVAAPIAPHPVTFAPIVETTPFTYTLLGGSEEEVVASAGSTLSAPSQLPVTRLAVWLPPEGASDLANARITWASPVEMLAALNAQGHAFTLVLMPEAADPYVSPGLRLAEFLPTPTLEEAAP